MRLFFTSDLHGRASHYDEIVWHVEDYQPEVVILGGDLFPRQGHSQSSVIYQIQFIETHFVRFLSRIKGIPILAILGNDDWAACLPILHRLESDTFHLIMDHPWIKESWLFKGYSYVPPTPFPAKDFEKRDCMDDVIPQNKVAYISDGHITSIETDDLFRGRTTIEEDMKLASIEKNPTIFISHGPPYGTQLDRLFNGQAVGSRAVRQYILNHQPYISLHGHIHESPGTTGQYWDWLGKTLCLNPGQTEKSLSAVAIDTNELQVNHTIYGPMPRM